jgi:hypothetical protein
MEKKKVIKDFDFSKFENKNLQPDQNPEKPDSNNFEALLEEDQNNVEL